MVGEIVVKKGITSCKTFVEDSILESKVAYQPMLVKLLCGYLFCNPKKLSEEEVIVFIKYLLRGEYLST